MVLDPHPDLAPAPAPTTSTPTTANTTTARSFTNPNPQPPSARPISPLPYPQPQHHHQHQHHLYATAASQAVRATSNHPPQQPHSQGILYPVASSGRGFIPKPPMQTVTVAANPGSASATYTPRTLVSYPHQHPVHIMRPPHTHTLPHHHLPSPQPGGPGSASASGPIKGIPVSSPPTKVIPASSLSDYNGYKDTRDRSRDDALVIIRNRKVRIADGASLYQLCRSWLRNGFPEEVQPQYAEAMKSLPKPLPIQMVATHLPKRKGVAEEEEEEEEGEEEEDEAEDKEDEESVDQLLPQDLLRRHIKHAKKVRSRLREERLRRIARYKSRLALLLPPLVEQLRNDAAGRN